MNNLDQQTLSSYFSSEIQRLQQALARGESQGSDSGHGSADVVERGVAAQGQMGNRALYEHHQWLLEQVKAAHHRLLEGSYGNCAGCGKVIPPARLEAVPHAIRCVACQGELERQPHRMAR